MEGGKRQPRDLLYCGVTSSKKTCVCKMYSLDSLSALTDNNDLPGIRRLMSGLQEHVQLPFSQTKQYYPSLQSLLQRAAAHAASMGRRDIVMYFVEEMGRHINEGVLTRELPGTPLIAATVRHTLDR